MFLGQGNQQQRHLRLSRLQAAAVLRSLLLLAPEAAELRSPPDTVIVLEMVVQHMLPPAARVRCQPSQCMLACDSALWLVLGGRPTTCLRLLRCSLGAASAVQHASLDLQAAGHAARPVAALVLAALLAGIRELPLQVLPLLQSTHQHACVALQAAGPAAHAADALALAPLLGDTWELPHLLLSLPVSID